MATDLRELQKAALRREYRAGMAAGIAETLDQLEGRSLLAPAGCYRGPMPDELLSWIAKVRRNVESAVGEEDRG